MSDIRFPWSRVSKLDAALELYKRGNSVDAYGNQSCKRVLIKDSPVACLAPDCRKKPKKGDSCYFPAKGLTRDNKTIGHVECIDRMVEKVIAKEELKHLAVPVKSRHERERNVPGLAVPSAGFHGGYYQGWQVGVKSIFEKQFQGQLDTSDPEWLKGYAEGYNFAMQHQKH